MSTLPRFLVIGCLAVAALPSTAAAVGSADQICAPADDPCMITSTVAIDDGSVIDFGTREVIVTGGGTIDIGAGAVTIRCGKFSSALAASATAINARGPNGSGGTSGGDLTLEARRACADASAAPCLSDADCGASTCSVGSASIEIDGKILGQGQDPAAILLVAADDVEISNNVNLNGTLAQSDGGTLELQSGFGSVRIAGNVKAESGGQSTGGDVCALAAVDVVVTAPIDVDGGDLDGGTITLEAGRDVVVRMDLSANATSGEGFGGEISLYAVGDIDVSANSPSSTIVMTANGHQSTNDGLSGGDGGPFELIAGGDVLIDSTVSILSNAAAPDGLGEVVSITAGGAVTLEGPIEASAKGSQGGGGALEVTAGGAVTVPNSASIDVSGGVEGSGRVSIDAAGDVLFNAPAVVTASNGGTADAFLLTGKGSTVIATNAEITLSGVSANDMNGRIEIDACQLSVLNGADITNTGDFAKNRFTIRESALFQLTSVVTADAFTGFNRIFYRDPAEPPVLQGTFTPEATLVLNETLEGCPVCGNGEIESGESCDDSNVVSGDGCSSACQDEGCIAETPGYPGVPLCDDGSACTADVCNAETSSCEHVVACDDGIECTVDLCDENDECINLVSDQLCDDGNPCTTDTCSLAARGCLMAGVTGPCDDGLDCTSDDACRGGFCIGSNNCPNGLSCNENTGQCTTGTTTTTLVPPGCGDGVVTPPEECDDGDNAWVPGEACQFDCGLLACGDPNDSGDTTASDALLILRAAVGSSFCDACICDLDDSGATNASDALRALRVSVGLVIPVVCPVCLL